METFPPLFCFPKSHNNENGGKVQLCNLHPSIIYSLPCDRIVKKAYCFCNFPYTNIMIKTYSLSICLQDDGLSKSSTNSSSTTARKISNHRSVTRFHTSPFLPFRHVSNALYQAIQLTGIRFISTGNLPLVTIAYTRSSFAVATKKCSVIYNKPAKVLH